MSTDVTVSESLGRFSGCFKEYIEQGSRWHHLKNSYAWDKVTPEECRRLITRYSVVYTTMLQSWFAHVTAYLKNPAAIEAVKAYCRPERENKRYGTIAKLAASIGISPSSEECASMQKVIDAMNRLFSGPQYEFSGLAALCLMDMVVEDYWIILLVAAQQCGASEETVHALEGYLDETIRRVWILEKALMLEAAYPGHVDVDLILECGLTTGLGLITSVFVDTIATRV